MSLFNSIRNAQGNSSAQYLKQGRHVCRVVRVTLRDADLAKNIKPGFSIDVEVLHSNQVGFNTPEGLMRKSDVVRAHDSMKFMNSALPLVKRSLAVLKASKEMRVIDENDLGLDKPTDEQYEAEIRRLTGPTQPLVGAIITINAVEKISKTGSPYTLFECFLPTEEDLKNAGLI